MKKAEVKQIIPEVVENLRAMLYGPKSRNFVQVIGGKVSADSYRTTVSMFGVEFEENHEHDFYAVRIPDRDPFRGTGYYTFKGLGGNVPAWDKFLDEVLRVTT